jgi:tetratricopeptide (TPR) repeat protein
MYQNPTSYEMGSNDNENTAIQKQCQQLKLAYHSTYLENLVSFDCMFDVTDLFANSSCFGGRSPMRGYNVQFQFGYFPFSLLELKPYLGISENGVDFFGAGIGMNIKRFNTGRDLGLTYQYCNDLTDGLAAAHSIYATVSLGKHREEIHAIKVREQLKLLPGNLYNKAMALFADKKYWEAYQIFARIITDFPDFFKNNDVSYHMALCLEELDLRTAAAKTFEETMAKFSSSTRFPYAMLGAMRVAYRQQNLDALTEKYQEMLSRNGPTSEMPDSLQNHAHYLRGQASMNQGKYRDAVACFSKIPESHPDFHYAQHSMAIAHMNLDDDPSVAISCLVNAIIAQPATKDDREISNRTYLLAGYLYYELDSLGMAVSALRMVPKESMYYGEALLGLGWTAIKAHQWSDCMTYGQQLATWGEDVVPQAEGLLIKAHAQLNLKRDNEAVSLLDDAKRKLDSYVPVSEDSLSFKKDQSEISRQSYDSLGTLFVELSKKSESETVSSRLDSLHGPQVRLKTKVDECARFFDQYKRTAFFGKNVSKVMEDIEYTRAKIELTNNGKEALKEVEKGQKKQDEVQEEIDKAKAELQKLQEDGQ